MRKSIADHLGLFVNLLCHKVTIVALVDQECRSDRLLHRARNLLATGVTHLDAFTTDHRQIAFFQVANLIGEWREGDRVGAEIHLAFAVADHKRRTLARADEEIRSSNRNASANAPRRRGREAAGDGLLRRAPLVHLRRHEMRDHLSVGFGRELRAV